MKQSEDNRFIDSSTDRFGNQRGGQEVAQQSQSLINYYKTLAFECNVECLGNVMIQPTMYFYLTNVPMFHGTYMIEEVSHSITPNNFITNFTGVRLLFIDHNHQISWCNR